MDVGFECWWDTKDLIFKNYIKNNMSEYIEEYRKKDIEDIVNHINHDAEKYNALMMNKKRIGKICTKIDLVLTACGIVITFIISLLGSNDIIHPKITIAVMETLFSIIATMMLLITRFGKLQNKKYYIYEKIKVFSLEQLNNLKIIYSDIFQDGEISKEDYEAVIKFKKEYDSKKLFIKTELGNGFTKIEAN